MKTSPRGLALIKSFEGLMRTAYLDIAGVPTIGYGHTRTVDARAVQDAETITEEEAETLLRRDVCAHELRVNDLVKVPLNQNEFDALVSFDFNTGGLHKSTSLKWLNRNDRIGAAEALTWWNKATVNGVKREVMGLTRRRAAEKELFLTPAREIAPEANTAKIQPEGEARPIHRLCGKHFDRAKLRNE